MVLDMTERIFALLYVSFMGLTRCCKTAFFDIYICSFSTEFALHMYTTAQSYLRFCKNKRMSYWNTTFGIDLL